MYLAFIQNFIIFLLAIAFVWPANQSRDVSLLVRPQEVTTKIWPTSACPQNESKSEDLFLLVIVFSAIKNFNERQTIRDTWASDEIPNSQVIFLLGHLGGNDSIPLQINVTKESETFGDILQEDFIDSYANLSLKTLMMLKWYEQSCSHVPYILKTDDDVYINMNNLYKLVKMNKIPNLLMGTLICGAVPIRDPYNKWYSPHYMYDKKRYCKNKLIPITIIFHAIYSSTDEKQSINFKFSMTLGIQIICQELVM